MGRIIAMLVLGLVAGCAGSASRGAPATLTGVSFNVWGAGANAGLSIDETVAALKAMDADIIGLQETRREGEVCSGETCPARGESRAPAIAAALGYFVYEQTDDNRALWANAVLSRYPITGASENDLGVSIDAGGRTVWAFNVHLWDYPYQPYQFAGIPYESAPFLETEEEGIEAARAARGDAVELLIGELSAAAGADAVFVFGDFNEPSWRDWTARAKAAGRHPEAVAYPSTRALEAAGFIDTYRAVYPDEMAHPGFTWTPLTSPDDPADHHDRIDYVFVKAGAAEIRAAAVIGEAVPPADIAVTPWPSDHRAALARIEFVR